MKTRLLILTAALGAALLSGCGDSVGDTNPVSPEQMEQYRNQRGTQTAPPNAGTERPPSSTGGR